MEPPNRRFLIAMTAAVVIATTAGLGVAETQSRSKPVVASSLLGEEQAAAPSVSVQRFFYLDEGEYAAAENLRGN